MNNFETILNTLQRRFGWKLVATPVWLLGLLIILFTHTKDAMLDTITNIFWMLLLPVIVFLPARREDEE